MWHQLVFGLVFSLVLAGCGFRSPAAGGGPGDAAIDGSGGGPGDGSGGGPGDGSSAPPGCFGHWLDGSVAIDSAAVTEIMELSSTGNDFAPWISNDGLRLYFARDLTPPGHGDFYVASRATPTGMFAPASLIASLNSSGHEDRVWLTSNELAAALSTTRDGPLNIDMTARVVGLPFSPPGTSHLAMVNAQGTMRRDPFLTDDLLRLYFSADSGPGGKLQLWIATRATVIDDFTPSLVPGGSGPSGINSSAFNVFSPALYQDERLMLFGGFTSGDTTTELFYATRASATDGFGAAASKIPTVNTDNNEMDPVLSADGCELYFASDRDADGLLHLFRAQVTR